MEAIVSTAEFKKALTAVGSTVAKRGSLPVLRGVHLDVGRGGVTLTTTDLDVTSQVAVNAVVNAPGRVLVEHATLAKIVKGKGDLLIRVSDDDTVEFANGITSKLRMMPLTDYPKIPKADKGGAKYPLDPAMLATVLPAASKEDSRPILTGVRFGENGELVATDSYRLHLACSGVEYPDLLIPARALALVVKVGLPATLHFVKDALDVRITAGRHTWFSRLIDGEYPNYRQLIPSNCPNRLLVERDRLVTALEGVKGVAQDSTTPVRLTMDPGADEVTITVATRDVGDSKAILPAKYGGLALTVAFTPSYLIDCVKVGAGDFVTIEMVDSLKPALFRDNDDPDTGLRLLMPVRVP